MHMVEIHTAEAWLERARQALALANSMHDEEARRTMLIIATKYEQMATRAALALNQQSRVPSDL